MLRRLALLLLGSLAFAAGCESMRTPGVPSAGYESISDRLDGIVRTEMGRHQIPGLAIAVVKGDRTVWAQAYGVEDEARGVPASLDTVWRAGSVSKMFTDLAVMRLVEQGRLDLDAPVTTWLPGFAPKGTNGAPITLRQLMAHRSGLVRETPVGSYFDASSPSIAATVASLNETELVYAPGAKTKYSNAGITVVGRVLEAATGRPFAQVVRDDVLAPMGLGHSAFEPTPAVRAHLAKAQMWTYWGTTFPAPTFELGIGPAGSLYATVRDLAQAMKVFLADGEGPRGAVVKPASLAEMWRPQFSDSAVPPTSGYGLGFFVDQFAGTRRVSHNGAIYGFSTVLELLPEIDAGVVVLASKDVAHGSIEKIAEEALNSLVRRERGEPQPALPPPPAELGKARALRLAGTYRSADGARTVDLMEQRGELWLCDRSLRGRARVAAGGEMVVDDLVLAKTRFTVTKEGEQIALGGVELDRVAAARPAAPPAEMTALIGEYGWDHEVLYVFEKDGELHALIEWFFDYPLKRESEDVWAFPDYGLYFGEKIVFERGSDGRASAAVAASVRFPRRVVGTEAGVTFRIEPTKPIPELRAAALAAQPPVEAARRSTQLVDLMPLDPTLHFDVRYATSDNFLGTAVYDEARAFLQKPAADALLGAQRALAKEGFGLLIHDAYRPWFVTRIFWDATPLEHHEMVADPSKGSRHNRGCAVDLTIYDLDTGDPVRMPSGYDEFSDRANPWYPGGTSEERWLRDTLRRAMEAQGFTVYEHEWWHFDYGTWRDYAVLNLRFEEIGATGTP